MIVAAFLMLLLVFTLFELLSDILRNQISPLTVGEYLLNVVPYFLYNTTPLSMLLAVLVTFGLLQHSNEITAIKATGISLYRIVVPVLLASIAGRRRALSLRPALSPLHQQASGRAAQPNQGQTGANLSSPRPQVDLRPALRHLLLSILRSRPRCFRRHLGVPVRSAHLPDHAPHLRRPCALVERHGPLGLRAGLGAESERLRHRELPQVRCCHLPRTGGSARLLQEGNQTIVGNEL